MQWQRQEAGAVYLSFAEHDGASRAKPPFAGTRRLPSNDVESLAVDALDAKSNRELPIGGELELAGVLPDDADELEFRAIGRFHGAPPRTASAQVLKMA